jgi:lipoate-protein ligase A
MAVDEVLLHSAAAGTASLRLYGWSEATLSLGYFQPEHLRRTDQRLVVLPFVRRPSGGDTLVHDREVTYALALPAGSPWQGTEAWPRRMHRILGDALAELGVSAQLHVAASQPSPFSGVLCFHHWTAGDLIVGTGKVVGSAQRRQRGSLMQHGAILLARSPHTPDLPGILELSGRSLTANHTIGAIVERFRRETGWEVVEDDWTTGERQSIAELVVGKYTQDAWNRKR